MKLDSGSVVVERGRALVYHGRHKILRVDPLGQLLQILKGGDGKECPGRESVGRRCRLSVNNYVLTTRN